MHFAITVYRLMEKKIITTLVALIILLLGTNLLSQNNTPVAVNDSLMPIFELDYTIITDTIISINVVENDFDPDGESIRICEVKSRLGQSYITAHTDSTIILTMPLMPTWEHVYNYRVCKINDTNSISNWAYLNVNPAAHPNLPIARNDTVIGIRGYSITINILKNDNHPLGDTVIIYSPSSTNDSCLTIYCPLYSNQDFFRRYYMIGDTTFSMHLFDRGLIYIKLLNNEWYDSLDINNINARFNCFGMQFWDLDGIPHFKVPNGSEVSSIFSQSLWMGGLDEQGDLHLAGERYRQSGIDYWTGPVSDVYDSLYDQRWMHVWKLHRNEIEYHKAHWWEADYDPLADILTWPGNGDVNLGQAEKIAPFEDFNNNGIYEPMLGDAPQIRGDQALFFVYNDAREAHGESEGIPLGVEIRSMAYAFDQPEDSAL
jgi:hypothetical protein